MTPKERARSLKAMWYDVPPEELEQHLDADDREQLLDIAGAIRAAVTEALEQAAKRLEERAGLQDQTIWGWRYIVETLQNEAAAIRRPAAAPSEVEP